MFVHYCNKLSKHHAIFDRLGRELLDFHAQAASTRDTIAQAYSTKAAEADPTQKQWIPAGKLCWTPVTVLKELEIPVSSEAGKLAKRILDRKNYGAYHPLIKRWLAYVIIALESPNNGEKKEEHVEFLKQVQQVKEILDYNDSPLVKQLLAELPLKNPTDKIYQEILIQTM